jgi:hypothetical protein
MIRMQSSIVSRLAKAARYAKEPDRVDVIRMELSFRGDNGTHKVSYEQKQWKCSCNYFGQHGYCSHVMAMERLLAPMFCKVTAAA